ncbi:MAG: TerC family protein [Rickettsiales bacterium]|nr:TerC family protein [Rickettsiales bacterium]
MEKPLWQWIVFGVVVVTLLILDLGVFNKKDREMSFKQSALMSAFYVAIACLFGLYIYLNLGAESSALYFTGYIIEKTLSLDNVFVISIIFTYFAIPRIYQHRVLFWGIVGVLILRAILIGIGASLIENFHWVLYIFAVFLIFTGFKMFFGGDEEIDIEQNKLLKFLRKNFKITKEIQGNKFFVSYTENNKKTLYITPLFVALLVIEFVDLVFALDSIPAIFAITTDPYIVYTSNIFAVLGLRALYFFLAEMVHRFIYLKPALAIVLIFIGSKIFISDFILGGEKFPINISILITTGIISAGVVYSLIKTRRPC